MLKYFYNINKSMDSECHICLEKKNKKDLIILTCMHSFHASCLYDWFEKENICPICMSKKNILYTSINRISYERKKQKMTNNCCKIL